jgi:hypothetical protein
LELWLSGAITVKVARLSGMLRNNPESGSIIEELAQ